MTRGTPKRSIRIPDPLWSRVQTQAAREGLTVSDLVRGLISGWLDEDDQQEGGEMNVSDEAVEAALCVSSFHHRLMPAAVRGTYANGQDVWYCEPCATMGESVGMFKRDETP